MGSTNSLLARPIGATVDRGTWCPWSGAEGHPRDPVRGEGRGGGLLCVAWLALHGGLGPSVGRRRWCSRGAERLPRCGACNERVATQGHTPSARSPRRRCWARCAVPSQRSNGRGIRMGAGCSSYDRGGTLHYPILRDHPPQCGGYHGQPTNSAPEARRCAPGRAPSPPRAPH
jgi:hypothetical protein